MPKPCSASPGSTRGNRTSARTRTPRSSRSGCVSRHGNLTTQHGTYQRHESCLTARLCRPQAWAEFKGKLTDGGQDNPASWKTRLRCALNKSPEFKEVNDRAQLDISEPYKVYRLVPISEQGETPTRLLHRNNLVMFHLQNVKNGANVLLDEVMRIKKETQLFVYKS